MKKENRESNINDIVEKLQKSEINREEALNALHERKLTEKKAWSSAFNIVPWIIYFALWIPMNFMFSSQVPVIMFPQVVIFISIGIVVLGMTLTFWSHYYHRNIGGLKQMETVMFFKEGPYRVVRHPEAVGTMPLMVLLRSSSAHMSPSRFFPLPLSLW